MRSIFKHSYIWMIFAAALSLSSCKDFEKEVDINLPPFESRLVVESYIEKGKPIKVSVMETQNYFDELKLPFVDSAEVLVTFKGKTDTLKWKRFDPFQSSNSLKYFNYVLNDSFNFLAGDVIYINVKDKKGRMVTAETHWKDPIKIDSIKHTFRASDSNAYILTHFTDPPGAGNKYRFRIINMTDSNRVYQDFFTSDIGIDGTSTAFGTAFRFKKNDTLEVSLFTLTDEFYDFLNTANAAANANGNPFAQPAVIRSNVKNGTGIFTFLPYDRRIYIVK